MLELIILLTLACQTVTLNCVGQDGQPVQWWVVLKTPPKIGINAYGYYDSSMSQENFDYYDLLVDTNRSALTLTIDAFNSQNHSRVAWND
jgi:hypothetical protein